MGPRTARWILLLLAVCPFTGAACDSGQDERAKAEAEAKAAEAKATDAKREARKKEREDKAAAEEKAKQEHEAKIDSLATLPDDVPTKLDKACKQMLGAYDKFMVSTLSGDMKTKWETGGKEMQLSVFKKECLKRTPRVAACQANALGKLPPDMKSDLAAVMQRCAAKFGPDAKSN